MEKITLELDLDEVNVILKLLYKEPFKDVFELIGKINYQANQQLGEDDA